MTDEQELGPPAEPEPIKRHPEPKPPKVPPVKPPTRKDPPATPPIVDPDPPGDAPKA